MFSSHFLYIWPMLHCPLLAWCVHFFKIIFLLLETAESRWATNLPTTLISAQKCHISSIYSTQLKRTQITEPHAYKRWRILLWLLVKCVCRGLYVPNYFWPTACMEVLELKNKIDPILASFHIFKHHRVWGRKWRSRSKWNYTVHALNKKAGNGDNSRGGGLGQEWSSDNVREEDTKTPEHQSEITLIYIYTLHS